MAKAVRTVAPAPMVVFGEPSEEVRRKQAVVRAMVDVFGWRQEKDALEVAEKALALGAEGGEVDVKLIEWMKGRYGAEIISVTLDRLRSCPSYRALAYGDPAPDGFVGQVDWSRQGPNAYWAD